MTDWMIYRIRLYDRSLDSDIWRMTVIYLNRICKLAVKSRSHLIFRGLVPRLTEACEPLGISNALEIPRDTHQNSLAILYSIFPSTDTLSEVPGITSYEGVGHWGCHSDCH
jgi:hypothetical protein